MTHITIETGTKLYYTNHRNPANPETRCNVEVEVTAVNSKWFTTSDGEKWIATYRSGTAWPKWGTASRMRGTYIYANPNTDLPIYTLSELMAANQKRADEVKAKEQEELAAKLALGVTGAIRKTIADSGDNFYGLSYDLGTLRRNLPAELQEDYVANLEYLLADALRDKADLKDSLKSFAERMLSRANRS